MQSMHVSILDHLPHINFDFARSLKVKHDGGNRLPIYDFLLVFNSNIWPNSATLRDIRVQNLSDLDIDLPNSPRSRVTAPTDSPYMLPY